MTQFSKNHLNAIMAFFNAELPGEMPNALMDQLARFLQREGHLKNVDTNPETSEFIHEYDSDSEVSESESEDDFDDTESTSSFYLSDSKPKTKRKPTKSKK